MNLLSQHREFYHNVRSIYKVYKHMPYIYTYTYINLCIVYIPTYLCTCTIYAWHFDLPHGNLFRDSCLSWYLVRLIGWMNPSGLAYVDLPYRGGFMLADLIVVTTHDITFSSHCTVCCWSFLMRDLIETLFCGSSRCVHWRFLSAQRAKRVNALVIRIMIHDGVSPK